ncbi:MFS transporter [Halioxenophilus aromaticivorans]
MSQAPLWTKDFILVSFLNFLAVLVFYLLVVVMGVYATEELGATSSQAGLAVGMFVVGVLAGRLLVGQYIDFLGRRRTLVAGLFLSIVTIGAYFLPVGIGGLVVFRFLHGASIGIAATAMGTIVAFLIPSARKGEGIGYYSMSSTLATATGPFIGMFMTTHTSFSHVLWLCLAVSSLSFLACWALKVPEVTAEDRAAIPRKFSVRRLVAAEAVPICGVIFVLGIFYSGVLSFLNAYARELDLVAAASFFFVAYSVAILISRPFTGRLLDLRGANLVMYPAFVLMVAGFGLLGMASEGWHLWLAGGLIGLGFGNSQSCIQAVALKIVDHHKMGLATATFFIFLDAGLGFGPYFLGLVVPMLGYASLFECVAGLVVVCAIGYAIAYGRIASKVQKQV